MTPASDKGAVARRGMMLVLSSPSGAGKSTLARKLLGSVTGVGLSVSATTRPRRGSEVEGSDYVFVDAEEFARRRDRGDFLEWAEVHGNLYATPRAPVEKALEEGTDVLFDIDWQGSRQLADAMGGDVVRVFILPPSLEELQARLFRRAEDGEETIARRLANARDEIGHWREYDYVIVNRDLQRSLDRVTSILLAERQRRERMTGLEPFVDDLLAPG